MFAIPEFEAASILFVFFEGIAAFVSPCILPMLPVYLIYLAGDQNDLHTSHKLRHRMKNTCGFVLGFTVLFVLMGAGATVIGSIFQSHKLLIQRISGAIMIIFGLHYAGVLKIGFLNQARRIEVSTDKLHFFSAVLFGAAFSLGWTPCLGTFLGSALVLAGNAQTVWKGMFLLFMFALGLGIPFLVVSVLYEKITPLLNFMKSHSKTVSVVSGVLLVMVGIALLFGVFGYYAGLFN